MTSSDVEELSNLLEVNRLQDIAELEEVLKVIKQRINKACEQATSKDAEKKWWRNSKKANQSEGKLARKGIIATATNAEKVETADKGDSKLQSKLAAGINDAEKFLQKLGDIGFKPTLTHGNMVASESYTLFQQGLKGIGNLHYAAIALSIVAYIFERVNVVGDNSGKCLTLLDRMYNLGRDMVSANQYLPENGDLLHRMLMAITKGAYFCCHYTQSGVFSRFGFATVNKDEFDALSKSMIDLSEKFVRASQVAVLKSLQEGQASLSDQMTQFSRQLQILAIQPNKSCSLVARLEGQTSLINNMTERKLLAYPVVTSLEPAHTTNTGYALPKASARDTEYSNVVLADRTLVSKAIREEPREEPTESKKTSGPSDRPENFQRLPKYMTDKHVEVQEIARRLDTVTVLDLIESTLSQIARAEDDFRRWAMLRVQSLGETEQSIFLDATNLFCDNWRWPLRKAKLAWRAVHGEMGDLSWQTLVKMSLVYDVLEEDTIKVRWEVRQFGRMMESGPLSTSVCSVGSVFTQSSDRLRTISA